VYNQGVVIDKIKTILKHPLTQQLKDIRFVGFCVYGILVLLVSWSAIGVIQTNYQLQKQISQLQQQNEVYQLQNNNLDLTNQYYKTDQYLELQARRQFGKAAPGETLVLVPKSVALAHTINLPSEETGTSAVTVIKKPFYQKNFEAWISFLFHRQIVEE
jgi:cell division protein FtsB